MTDNIEKLYKLAKIEATTIGCTNEDAIDCEGDCIDCTWYDTDETYPPFTAEKQLDLIKWLCVKTYRNYFKIKADYSGNNWYMECNLVSPPTKKDFSQALAGLVCELWDELTEQQKEEIKEILK